MYISASGDGVHWDMTAHRRITNLILTHIAQAWDVKPPEHARKLLHVVCRVVVVDVMTSPSHVVQLGTHVDSVLSVWMNR